MTNRMLYVDGWDRIHADPGQVTDLGDFCRSHGIDGLVLYNLHEVLDAPGRFTAHAAALRTVRRDYGIGRVLAAFSSMAQVDQVVAYQTALGIDAEAAFSGLILEHEWWNASPRDFAGALALLRYTRGRGAEIAQPLGLTAYVGWLTREEAADLAAVVDELAIHAYRPEAEGTFAYTQERLSFFEGRSVAVRPIFSAEDDFMGSWLRANGLLKAEFHGSHVTSDTGLILVRELDERLGLERLIADHLSDSRQSLNTQFRLSDLLRQSVYSRLAGYEDLNEPRACQRIRRFA